MERVYLDTYLFFIIDNYEIITGIIINGYWVKSTFILPKTGFGIKELNGSNQKHYIISQKVESVRVRRGGMKILSLFRYVYFNNKTVYISVEENGTINADMYLPMYDKDGNILLKPVIGEMPPFKPMKAKRGQPKGKCLTCEKEYTVKTLSKYNGICYSCFSKTRPAITKKLRREVWEKRSDKTISLCYSCNKHIDIDNFECGHIIAFVNGGKTMLSNLEPICKMCNKSCYTTNLDIFMASLK